MTLLFKLLKISFIFFAFYCHFSLNGQIIRTINKSSGSAENYIPIYEYNTIDVNPEFPGGNMEMLNFINHERRYPRDAYNNGIEGRVVCGFIVDSDGTISNVMVMKGVEESLDREAVRIITMMPRWISGRLGDDAVPVFCTLAIPFRK